MVWAGQRYSNTNTSAERRDSGKLQKGTGPGTARSSSWAACPVTTTGSWASANSPPVNCSWRPTTRVARRTRTGWVAFSKGRKGWGPRARESTQKCQHRLQSAGPASGDRKWCRLPSPGRKVVGWEAQGWQDGARRARQRYRSLPPGLLGSPCTSTLTWTGNWHPAPAPGARDNSPVCHLARTASCVRNPTACVPACLRPCVPACLHPCVPASLRA